MSLERRTPLKRTAPKRRRSPRLAVEFSELVKSRSAVRFSFSCATCSGPIDQFHHRMMRSAGGRGAQENCLPVCHVCHRRIHDNPGWAYRHGLLVRRTADPARIGLHLNCGVGCPVDHVGDSVVAP